MALNQIAKSKFIRIAKNENLAKALAEYAINFIRNEKLTTPEVVNRAKYLFIDSYFNGLSGSQSKFDWWHNCFLECTTQNRINAVSPTKFFSKYYGSPKNSEKISEEKAILLNCIANELWGNNAVIFSFNDRKQLQFSYNDYYPVVISAAQQTRYIGGGLLLKGFVLIDEIRGRLFESLDLNPLGANPLIAGAVASIVTSGAIKGASPDLIEEAVDYFWSNNFPYIFGEELDNISSIPNAFITESAILSLKRVLSGFIFGGKGILHQCQITDNILKKDIILNCEGKNFSIMNSNLMLGIHKFYFSSVIEAVVNIFQKNEFSKENIKNIKIIVYEPFFRFLEKSMRIPADRRSAIKSLPFIGK